MAASVRATPAGYHSVTPYMICKGAADAIEYYKKRLVPWRRCGWQDPMGGLAMRS
jgi:hypothetical protein